MLILVFQAKQIYELDTFSVPNAHHLIFLTLCVKLNAIYLFPSARNMIATI